MGQQGFVDFGQFGMFEGPTQGQESLPPDCSIDVSPDWVVAITNGTIMALDRNNSFAATTETESTFWGGGFDPRVTWDPRDGNNSQFA